MKPTIGQIVHYVLSAVDCERICRNRKQKWPGGDQAYLGNDVSIGELMPMIVCVVWSNEYVNGQVFLDGDDLLWVTSVKEGVEPGTWRSPERS